MENRDQMTTSHESHLDLADLECFIDFQQMQMTSEDHIGPDLVMELLTKMADIIGFMPSSSALDLRNIDKETLGTAYLHYIFEGADYYVTHRDRNAKQLKAFGMIVRVRGPMMFSFIDIVDLIKAGAEIELDWEPKLATEIKLRNSN
jgi:hypothetical protein